MRSSGALSICSSERARPPYEAAITFVIALVSVVFPWSTCPMVPTLRCSLPICVLLVLGRAGPSPESARVQTRRPPRAAAGGGLEERELSARLLTLYRL